MKWSYGAYDALFDIGPRMRERLAAYGDRRAQRTAVPWALAEPARPAVADPRLRAELFPRAKLALLYSGTMGRAHDYRAFLALARACRARSGDDVAFCFSSRGNRQDELRAARDARRHQRQLGPLRRRGGAGGAPRRRRPAPRQPATRRGPASWSPRSSSARWRSGARSSTPVRATPRSPAGWRSTTSVSPSPTAALSRRRRSAARARRRPAALGRWQDQRLRRLPARLLQEGRSTTAGTRRCARLSPGAAPPDGRYIPSAARTTAAMASAELPFET